ncbi:MBOAT family protein [Paenibacillus filicis]|uniref:MBOAT family protein n=1 Tax=Paenibacillus gyeongsangnamensis TaxID=3388067 RepID=A0ABT4Q730_9BACL|nr:MBOAT family O-acyltransferase [Paenibacillus filicis]MCZ8512681.1 MBOAT family protein [Paenibacillus filicis]
MVFSSLIFLYLFLPMLLAVYFLSGRMAYRNAVLIVFSFAFYAWGEPVWIVLLIACAFLGYLFALAIEKYRGTRLAKPLFVLSVAVNLLVLCYFKYTGFLLDNMSALLHWNLPHQEIGLPIGISFFTFEIISYMADVYKGTLKAPRSPAHIFLYVSFFPHLIAGPIIRYVDIEEQMKSRPFSLSLFSEGVTRFMIGLGKKVIIANTIGEHVTNLLQHGGAGTHSVLGAWFGIALFALQIYFDFSGYSDMAIGLGKMFGFTLRENFHYPYVSRSASEFWRRWNISLGSFFRDYVYIPLGGNRRLYLRNLFVVWFLTGLWHGASWNFIVWGLYFGLLIWLERAFLSRLLEAAPRLVSHTYLTAAMLIGWVWFYYTDLSEGLGLIQVMFGATGKPLANVELGIVFYDNLLIFLLAAIGATPLPAFLARRIIDLLRLQDTALGRTLVPVMNFGLFAVSTLLLVGSTYNPFLYYRF